VPIVFTIVTPLVLVPFLQPVLGAALRNAGVRGATGAEQAVPGLAVLFAFFLISFVGDVFFREHSWHTWDRLRLAPLARLEIMMGKALPAVGVITLEIGSLLALGSVLFGLPVRGSLIALIAVVVAFGVAVVAIALLLVSVCRTTQQLDMVGVLAAMVCSGLGGALTPVSSLPAVARHVAPATPTYWAMKGFRAVLLDGRGVTSCIEPVLVLAGIAAVAMAATAYRFRFEDRKSTWT
jgi:ABC-2 type transport system permease protein